MATRVYTAKSECTVQLDYHCSKCGTHNQPKQIIRAYSDSGNSINASSNAHEKIEGILLDMCRYNPANRFTNAGFSCKCSSCGHREPWAKISRKPIHIPVRLLSVLLVFGIMFLMEKHPLGYIGLALGAAYLLSIPLGKFRAKQLKQEIPQLPTQSIPKVKLLKNDGDYVELVPVTEVPANSWLCANCGEFNPNHQSSCGYCGVAKAWSLSKQGK